MDLSALSKEGFRVAVEGDGKLSKIDLNCEEL